MGAALSMQARDQVAIMHFSNWAVTAVQEEFMLVGAP